MEDKEKDLNVENLEEKDTASQDNPSIGDNGVKYETSDNWEFDAKAPTIDEDFLTGNENFVVDKESLKSQVEEYAPKKNADSSKTSGGQIVISKDSVKFISVAIITLIAIITFVILGVRYYTVPNGKEGDLMNPASVAATIDNEKISLGMFNYYYSSVVNYYEQYAAYGYFNLDTSKSYDEQYTENSNGEKVTWTERFLEEAMNEIAYSTVLYNEAVKAGVTLSKDQELGMQTQFDSMKKTASEQNISFDEYLSKNFGEYCTEETVTRIMEQYYLSLNYKGLLATQRDYTDKDIEKFFEENKNDYYQVNYSFMALPYDTTDEETTKKSDEDIKKYMDQVTDRDSIINLIPTVYKEYIDQEVEYALQNDSSLTEDKVREEAIKNFEQNVDGTIVGSNSPFSDEINTWLFDENSKVGEKKLYTDNESGYAYIIIKTGKPERMDSETYSVRHILITPSTQENENVAQEAEDAAAELTEEDWERAKEKAQKILDEYNSGDKTEFSFADLAEKNSEDTGSTSAASSDNYGGLYEAIGLGQMVPSFEEWATDDSRKYGDTGIVKSDYGYHIMFFVYDLPQYQGNIIKDMRTKTIKDKRDSVEIKTHKSVVTKACEKYYADKLAAQAAAQAQAQAQGQSSGYDDNVAAE